MNSTGTCERVDTDTHDKNKGSLPEQEPTEERFFEQFARSRMGSHSFNFRCAAHIRQSTYPTNGKREIATEFDSGYPETAAEVVQSKASYCHSK
jgi:hypothetical protein